MRPLIVLALVLSAEAFSQTITVNMGNLVITTEQAAAYESWRMTNFANLATPITLTSSLDSGATKTFALTGDLTQLAVGNEISIESEMMPVTAISGQNVTVTRAPYTISTWTISTPTVHAAVAAVNLLRLASAVGGFKQIIAAQMWSVVLQYCGSHPATCPSFSAQITAKANADAALAAMQVGMVQ